MAFSATTEWDVRTTGNAANGGGFDTASSGTDYSQQDSPQISYTDMVIDGTTNTKFTSSGNPVTAQHVGNIINVTGGTGFTVQRVQIVSQVAGVATCDKSLGTLSSTGGTGNLGGSLLTIGAAVALVVNSNKINVKSGTYTLTATVTVNNVVQIIGYNTTHNDGGTKPLITTSTNSTPLFTFNSTVTFRNLSMSNTAGTRAAAIFCGANFNIANLDLCLIDGCSYGVLADNGTAAAGSVGIWRTEIKNCTVGGVYCWFQILIDASKIHDNTGTGVAKSSTQNSAVAITKTILANNTIGVDTANFNGCFTLASCTVTGNTSHGVTGASFGTWTNNIIYGNGGWGINGIPTGNVGYNAFGSNTSGDVNGSYTSAGNVALSANPFTNSAGGDYTLNNTAGGGAACRGAGYQWT